MEQMHISSSFDENLSKLKETIIKMGNILSQKLTSMARSLDKEPDAAEVAAFEKEINDYEVGLDKECVNLLALHNPAASDLRFVISSSRIVNELESIGDEINRLDQALINIHKNSKDDVDITAILGEISQIIINLRDLLNKMLAAYQENNVQVIVECILQERDMDEQFRNAIRSRITLVMEEPQHVKNFVHGFWMLRSLERIGKCTRQVGNHVLYHLRGRDVRHKSREYLAEKYLNK